MTKPMPREEKQQRKEWRALVHRLNKKFGPLDLVSEPIRKMIAAEVVQHYDLKAKSGTR